MTAKPITIAVSATGLPPPAAATPPIVVPNRMARKVAASTSALPAGNSSLASCSGRRPYLVGENSRSEHAEEEESDEEDGYRFEQEAYDRHARGGDFAEFQPFGDQPLVISVGELPAEARQKKEGCDEDRAAERHQHFAGGAAELEQDQDDEGVLEEIVVEGSEELAPEERRKTARSQE